MCRHLKFSPLLALLLLVRLAAFAADGNLPWAKWEPLASQEYPHGLTESDLKDLPLTDPKLRVAYIWLVRAAHSWGPVADERIPEMLEVLKDVKRRADSTTPLWLDIMAKNQNTRFETYVPGIIARVGTIKMEPYVEYFRKMIQTRPDEINFQTAGEVLRIFFEYGTKEDVKLVEALARRGPIMASAIKTAFEKEQMRTTPPNKSANPATTPNPIPAVEPQSPGKAPGTNPAPDEAASSTPWTIVTVVVSLAAALGLLWLLLKRRS